MAVGVTLSQFMSFPRTEAEDEDVAMAVFTNNMQAARDITGKFVLESQLKDIGGKAVRVDTARVDPKTGRLVPLMERLAFIDPHVEYGDQRKVMGGNPVRRWLSYDADTMDGDCGAPITLRNYSFFNFQVLCGFHTAHGEGRAWGAVLTHETIMRLENTLTSRGHIKHQIGECSPKETDDICEKLEPGRLRGKVSGYIRSSMTYF
jgi:hypothetical protein